MRVIIEGSEHPTEPDCPFTRLRKKTTISISGMPEEYPNQVIQERGKAMSFQASPRRNDDSTDGEDDAKGIHVKEEEVAFGVTDLCF